MMTNLEFTDKLIEYVNKPTYYKNRFPENCGYFNGKAWGFDCVCLLKVAMSNYTLSQEVGSYLSPKKFVCGDISENQMLNACKRMGTDFSKIPAYGSLLWMQGHIGCYVGEHKIIVGGQERIVNAIECTTSYGASKVTWSWFDLDGSRRRYKGYPFANKKWIAWGVMDKWINYVSINPEEPKEKPEVPAPTIRKGTKGDKALMLQQCLNYTINAGLDEDGDIGPLSVAQIKRFQSMYGLAADGIYGPKTYEKMKIVCK